MFHYWADPVVHLLLLKISTDHFPIYLSSAPPPFPPTLSSFSLFFFSEALLKKTANWQLVTHKNHCMEVNEESVHKTGPFNSQVHGQGEDY